MLQIAFCLVLCITLGAFAIDEELMFGFLKYGIQPDVIPFGPIERLTVVFPSGAEVKVGNMLGIEDIQEKPTIGFEAREIGFYTLAAIDAGIPSRVKRSKSKPYLQWMVVNIRKADVKTGDELFKFKNSEPGPTKLLGFTAANRYVYLVYMQPRPFSHEEMEIMQRTIERESFAIADTFFEYNMSVPIAGNFFLAKNDLHIKIPLKDLLKTNFLKPRSSEEKNSLDSHFAMSSSKESSSGESSSKEASSENRKP